MNFAHKVNCPTTKYISGIMMKINQTFPGGRIFTSFKKVSVNNMQINKIIPSWEELGRSTSKLMQGVWLVDAFEDV